MGCPSLGLRGQSTPPVPRCHSKLSIILLCETQAPGALSHSGSNQNVFGDASEALGWPDCICAALP
jgi:hypothetical protein